jgi:glycosyltransferase involved in cell wall biosynthesis
VRICYIVSEWFRWGQHGGYGTITRALAEGLAARGHEVSALVVKKTAEARRDQADVEEVEGVTVIGLPNSYIGRLRHRERYTCSGAELYVAVDARFDSWLAMRLAPAAKHVVWLIDPMPFDAYWSQHRTDPRRARFGEKLATRLAFEALQVFRRRAVRGADALLSQPEQLAPRVRAVFGVTRPIHFAPNPVALPELPIAKAERPLVLFLGRFDWQKQPRVFFELARRLPEVDFVAAGAASDPATDAALREAAADIPNLELPGVVGGEAKDRLLRRAWVLCNTSLREGLPRSFQEAQSYECALLAAVDPDGLVGRFGYHAGDRDFALGVRSLLEADRWRELGRAGRRALGETHERERALDRHEELYRAVLAGRLS